MTRETVKEKLTNLVSLNKAVLLTWCTGTGKTLASIYQADRIGAKKVLVVLGNNIHENEWLKDATKWEYDISHYQFTHYRSLKKYTDHYDLVIFDECDVITEAAVESIGFTTDKFLFLSAYVPKEKRILLRRVCPYKEFEITLVEAIRAGFLKKPIIHVTDIELSNIPNTCVYVTGKDKSKKNIQCNYLERFKYSKQEYNLYISCSEVEYYEMLLNKKGWFQKKVKEDKSPYLITSLKRTGLDIKNHFVNCKLKFAKRIADKATLKGYRWISFSNTEDQAKFLSPNIISSELGEKINDQRVLDFNEGRIDNLSTIKMADRAMNLERIKVGIVLSFDKEITRLVQTFGRAMRSEEPLIFIIRVKGKEDKKTEEFLEPLKEYCVPLTLK